MKLIDSPFANARLREEMNLLSLCGIAELAGTDVRKIMAARDAGEMPAPSFTSPTGKKKLWGREGIRLWLEGADLEKYAGSKTQKPALAENDVLRQTQEFYKAINKWAKKQK